MKKVYIPAKKELLELQSIGVNVYRYLLSKVIETLIMEDVIYEDENMFDYIYNYLPEFREILVSVARMYPERIKDSDRASNDIVLCQSLLKPLSRYNNNAIYQLDNLTYFNQESQILYDRDIIRTVSEVLEEELPTNPRYRFDYKEPNTLLDDIFDCSIPLVASEVKTNQSLIDIDPIYFVKYLDIFNKKHQYATNLSSIITKSTLRYAGRYGLENNAQYRGQDIINNPDEKVKKLLKKLEQHKNIFI